TPLRTQGRVQGEGGAGLGRHQRTMPVRAEQREGTQRGLQHWPQPLWSLPRHRSRRWQSANLVGQAAARSCSAPALTLRGPFPRKEASMTKLFLSAAGVFALSFGASLLLFVLPGASIHHPSVKGLDYWAAILSRTVGPGTVRLTLLGLGLAVAGIA